MAKKEVTIVLKAIDEASKVFENAAKNTLPAFAKSLAQVATGFVSVAAAEELFRGSIAAYVESEKVANQLTATLRSQGSAFGDLTPKLLAQAEALSKVSVESHETITAAQQILISVGGLLGPALTKATKASLDLSYGMGKPLTEAALMVAKAAEGATREFSRLGVKFQAHTTDAEKLSVVYDWIQKNMPRFTDALNTEAGAISQAEHAWKELEETLGKVLVTAAGGAEGLRGFTQDLRALNEEANNPKAMGLWTSLLILFAGAAGTGASMAGGTFSTALLAIITDAEKAAKSVGKLDDTLTDAQREKVLWNAMDKDFAKVFEARAEAAAAAAKKLAAEIARGNAEFEKLALEQKIDTGVKPHVDDTALSKFFQDWDAAQKARIEGIHDYVDAVFALSTNVDTVAEAWRIVKKEQDTVAEATPAQAAALKAMGANLLITAAAAEQHAANMKTLQDAESQAAVQLGDTAVEAAFGADVAWGEALKNILEGFAKAIVQAFILKLVTNILSGSFGGSSAMSAGPAGGGISIGGGMYGLADGGVVPQYAAHGMMVPRGTDTIPAMLTPGEIVIPRAASQSILGGRASLVSSGGGGRPTLVTVNLGGETLTRLLIRNSGSVEAVNDYIDSRRD